MTEPEDFRAELKEIEESGTLLSHKGSPYRTLLLHVLPALEEKDKEIADLQGDLDVARTCCEVCNKEIADLRMEIGELEVEIDSADRKIVELRSTIRDKVAENIDLKDNIDRHLSIIIEKDNEIDRLRAENRRLKVDIKFQCSVLSDNGHLLVERMNMIQEKDKVIVKLTKELGDMRKRLKYVEEQHKVYFDLYNKRVVDIVNLKRDLANKEDEIKKLKGQLNFYDELVIK